MNETLKNKWLNLGFEYSETKTSVNLTMKRYNYQEQYKFYKECFVHTISTFDAKTKVGKTEVVSIDYTMLELVVKTIKEISKNGKTIYNV